MITNEIVLQVYRGGFTGSSNPTVRHDKLAAAVQRFTPAGIDKFAMHGGPWELIDAWDGLAKLLADLGCQGLASWGLDAEHDPAGLPATGSEKGAAMGEVLAQKTCLAGLADAEGRWDNADADRPGSVTDRDNVLEMGEALRAKAPGALVGDQCWFAIREHGHLRRVPADPQDVFAGFPVDEFARKVVNWFQFRQAYCNDYTKQWQRARYRRVFDWMDQEWAPLEAPFKAAGLHYNPGITIQAYGWDDIPADLLHCLIAYLGLKQQPVVAWWEPAHNPDVFIAACKAYQFLKGRGFIVSGRAPEEIVRRYQRSYNLTSDVHIDEDGRGGYKTWASMGIAVGG